MNKKNQNSILFLTTLGVYIGLLVAGSAPGVVAQQSGAMTRNFELSEEVEVKNDLDLDPESGSEIAELEELLLSSSFEPLVRVYLSQFAVASVEPTTNRARMDSSVESAPTNLKYSQHSFDPNNVRNSTVLTITSLPRAGLDALLAKDAK